MREVKIPEIIKNKIVGEANWRSTNGHGGVDDITRDNFILAAEYGYQLSLLSIHEFETQKADWNGQCQCGHKHSEHHPISSHNYSAGHCTIGECRCKHFIHNSTT